MKVASLTSELKKLRMNKENQPSSQADNASIKSSTDFQKISSNSVDIANQSGIVEKSVCKSGDVENDDQSETDVLSDTIDQYVATIGSSGSKQRRSARIAKKSQNKSQFDY